MRWFKTLLVLSFIVIGCSLNWKPTPLLVGDLFKLNTQTHQLYLECSEGRVFNANKEGCQLDLLETKLKKIREVAKNFISADIKQPHGYDIYLENTIIYFSVAYRNADEYSEAERIAKQFFEIQMRTSGRLLDLARTYWAIFMAENLAREMVEENFTENPDRIAEMNKCLIEAHIALNNESLGYRRVNLLSAIEVFEYINERY